MSDPIRQLQDELAAFTRARDWERYHTPRNLAALVASEAGELLAHFRWDEDALAERPQEVEDEIADVFLGILRFADVAGIDLAAAARRKIVKNAEKYPAREAGPGRRASHTAPAVAADSGPG
jgi:dCTP diphosphatase